MSNTQIVQAEALRSLIYTSMGASYVAVGTKFLHPIRLVGITNGTNGALLLSTDGSTDHLFIPAGGYKLFDLTVNRNLTDPQFVLPTGTQFYVKLSGAPSSGSVYIEALYGVQS